jgi:nucleotide-binding universal stress UspA family protein
LPVATALAASHNATLLLAHVVARPEFFQRTPLTAADRALSEQIVARNVKQATAYLEELRTRLSPAPSTHVQIGDCVTAALHRLINEEQCDLIILSAHGGAGNNHFPYGDAVANLIAYGQTPLLILQDQPASRLAAAQNVQDQYNPREKLAEHGVSGYGEGYNEQIPQLRALA